MPLPERHILEPEVLDRGGRRRRPRRPRTVVLMGLLHVAWLAAVIALVAALLAAGRWDAVRPVLLGAALLSAGIWYLQARLLVRWLRSFTRLTWRWHS